jgi:hypothetical protein
MSKEHESHINSSEFSIRQCATSAGRAFTKNFAIVLLTVLVLPLPGFLFWGDAPLAILCLEFTLLDCFYLIAAVFLIFGMFRSVDNKISLRTVLSSFLHPLSVAKRCWQFFYSESSSIWKSLWGMTLGIVFGLGAQWMAAPWKIPVEQNLFGAGVYLAFLLLWSQDLVGWMLAPYYLANEDLAADQAYQRSKFSDKEHKHWNLRLTAVLCILAPVLTFGVMRFLLLNSADFENYQLNPLLHYFTSLIPWTMSVFVLFVWNEIYRTRHAQ